MSKRRRRSSDGSDAGSYTASETSSVHSNCPLDKDQLGRKTWGLLHTIAAYYPDKPSREQRDVMLTFIETFGQVYPCPSCASHFREQMQLFPPEVDSQQSLSLWFCKMHNLVNQRLGKPLFDCKRINERWRDGWRDGSCDD